MNSKKAKALRKQVYGDISHRAREYKPGHEPQASEIIGAKRFSRWYNPTCICAGLRRKYQDAKRAA